MAESDQVPLLEGEDVPSHPPPKYEPVKDEAPTIPVSGRRSDLPLPTYAQSEKYEQDGVLEYSSDQEDQSDSSRQVVPAGTCCEFTFFLIVCAIFSVIGFIFSFCVASTVAAQSGALTGLGIAFVSKPLMFEMYSTDYVNQHSRQSYCNGYWGYHSDEQVSACVQRSYTVLRFFFWVIGLIGLFLIYKGTSHFLRTRGSRSSQE